MKLLDSYLRCFCGLGVSEIEGKLSKDFKSDSDISLARHYVYVYLVNKNKKH